MRQIQPKQRESIPALLETLAGFKSHTPFMKPSAGISSPSEPPPSNGELGKFISQDCRMRCWSWREAKLSVRPLLLKKTSLHGNCRAQTVSTVHPMEVKPQNSAQIRVLGSRVCFFNSPSAADQDGISFPFP